MSAPATPYLDTWYPDHRTQTRTRTLERIIADLWYQYPTGVSTFSKCVDGGCQDRARGGALCPQCVTNALAELVGSESAHIYACTVRQCAAARAEMYAAVSEG